MPSWYRYPICAPVLPHSGIRGQGNGERRGREEQERKGERERVRENGINDKMNRVPGNQLGFEFGPLASLSSLFSLSRWFEDSRKTWSRTSERSPYLYARARALGPLRSAQSVPSLPPVCVNAALFLKILPSILPPPPSLLPFHLFQAAYRRPWLLVVFIHTFISLFLKFNLLFGNVAFEKHDSFILYFMYRLLLLWWSPNRCCCQGNKQRIGFSWLGKKLLEIISRKIG